MQADTTFVIAASYEAKAHGVKTGTMVRDAKRLCRGIALVEANHAHYVKFHHDVIAAVDTVLPVHAVHSIDEFSCRLLGEEKRREKAEELGRAMKRAIIARCGECIRSSVGISTSRWMSKIAADMQKPDGLTIVDDHELPARLFALQLQDLPGIGPRMHKRLLAQGVTSVEQLASFGRNKMVNLWGSTWGEFVWRGMRGEDVHEPATKRSSFGHQHVLPPQRRTEEGARAIVAKLLAKAASRLRHGGYCTRRVVLSIRYLDREFPREVRLGDDGATKPRKSWNGELPIPETDDTLTLMREVLRLWAGRPVGTPLRVGVALVDVIPRGFATGTLFEEARKRGGLGAVMDRINSRLGRNSVYFAAMHSAKDSAPTRIAFNHIPDREMPEIRDELEEKEGEAGSGRG